MGTRAKAQPEGVFHLQPAGTFGAVCYAVHDLGWQQGEYLGVPNVAQKIIFSFEINKRISSEDSWNNKRYTIHLWLTNSLCKKANLPPLLEAWLGRQLTDKEYLEGFECADMVGKNCMLNIIHKDSNGKPSAKIKGVMALPEGMTEITAESSKETPEWIVKIQAKALTDAEAEAIRNKAHEEEVPF